MFNKEESAKIRKEFWISFGKSFPKKWLLYDTNIKGFTFKFVADRKKALICLDFEHPDEIANELLYDKLLALKNILLTEYLSNAIYDDAYELQESGKIIRRIYIVHQTKFSIHNKNTWRDCYEFFIENMSKFESFFYKYENFIKETI